MEPFGTARVPLSGGSMSAQVEVETFRHGPVAAIVKNQSLTRPKRQLLPLALTAPGHPAFVYLIIRRIGELAGTLPLPKKALNCSAQST